MMLPTDGTPTLNPHHTAPRMYRRSRPVVLNLVSSSKRKWTINGHVRSNVRERILNPYIGSFVKELVGWVDRTG